MSDFVFDDLAPALEVTDGAEVDLATVGCVVVLVRKMALGLTRDGVTILPLSLSSPSLMSKTC